MAERTYRIHIAAELSGVRVELIRAWERRYGVLNPQRTPAGYRAYTDRDVALLKRLKKLTDEGVAISEAAKLLPELLAELHTEPAPSAVGSEQGLNLVAWQEAALIAARVYDQAGVSAVLDEVFAALSPLRAFDDVLTPLLREVGERWHAGRLTVSQEHLVTQVVRTRLLGLLHAAPNVGRKHAVLACFPEEEHELGLLGAALRLRHSGIRVTLLGQRMPAADLAHAVEELRPDFVGLSAVNDRGVEVFQQMLSSIVEALPRGMPLWAGGLAAQAHPEVCVRLGVRLFSEEDDWVRLAE